MPTKSSNFEPDGRKRIGFDVADSGADKCVTSIATAPVVY